MRCPICDRSFSPEDPDVAMPFCSQRCKSIDLNRWFNEEYSIESVNLDQLEKEIAELDPSSLDDESSDSE